MNNLLSLFFGALQILLLNLVLSGDNIAVIALTVKDLPKSVAKKASIIGISAAILLRIIFTLFASYILLIEWLPIKLVAGLLLLKITFDLIKSSSVIEEKNNEDAIKITDKFEKAIFNIILADISMSLDNVLAIACMANNNYILLIIGLVISIPIILYGSNFIANLMKKYYIVIYISGAILARTSIQMILEEKFILLHIPHIFAMFFPLLAAFLAFAYGIYTNSFLLKLKRENE
jgi:YjbE family integral membrane protein